MEKHIIKAIKTELHRRGWLVFKLHGGAFQEAGLPDLLALMDGKAAFIEVKQPRKKPTPLQAAMIEKLQKYGCRAGVATNIDEALRIISDEVF
jgi:Holliday junction resolvase